MARESYAFKIDLASVAPTHDPSWRLASATLRGEYLRAVVAIALEVKDRELAAGLDRDGNPLVPISRYTREHRRSAMGPADPNAPPRN